MIQLSATEIPTSDWQTQLRDGFNDATTLLHYLDIAPSSFCDAAQNDFAVRVPLSFAQRMAKGDINDPLLKQVLPINAETQTTAGFIKDPVGDLQAMQQKGLIQKYHGRVLIITTGACAINCRYCFRRSFPYNEQRLSKIDRLAIIKTIHNDNSINEVILSGGDPLLLSDKKLIEWFDAIEAIPHIKRLRIHTRLPVVIPDRVTPALCQRLHQSRLPVTIVLHINHPNEINTTFRAAIQQLQHPNVHLLNQSVLLQGVNDSSNTLIKLSDDLLSANILPYYLHVLDKIEGSSHFDVSIKKALHLHKIMKHKLPGYLVPKLVKETAGELSKTWVYN